VDVEVDLHKVVSGFLLLEYGLSQGTHADGVIQVLSKLCQR
jgi:hypothetical protein